VERAASFLLDRMGFHSPPQTKKYLDDIWPRRSRKGRWGPGICVALSFDGHPAKRKEGGPILKIRGGPRTLIYAIAILID